MAMMKRLRDNTHIILWALLIMFVLSMTIGGLVGGADITDLFSKNRRLQGKAGVVNGNELDGMYYSRLLQQQLDEYRENGQEITEALVENVGDQIWQSFINETLIDEEIKRLNLEVTSSELYEYLMQYPPEFLTSQEVFQTDGKFDRQKYINALTNVQGDEWLNIEQYLFSMLRFQKIQLLIENLPIISASEVREEYIRTKVPFTLETLLFPFSMVATDSVDITEAEIEAYYSEHKEDYFVKESREMDYVFFEIKPSREDSLSRYELAMELKKRILSGEAFETVAAEFTEDPSGKNSGGDLGWFDRNQMVASFSDAAFHLKKGEVSDPVLTQFGYHLIKVEDKRNQKGQPQVKARHILLKIEPGPETLSKIRSQASLFAFDAADIGFRAAADSHRVIVKSTDKLQKDNSYIRGLGSFKQAVQFAFSDHPIGTVSELLGADNGYAVFQLTTIHPEHYKPLADVRETIRLTLINEKRVEQLKEKADEVVRELQAGAEFRALAQSEDGIRYDLHKDILLNKNLKGITLSNSIVGAVLGMQDGQISDPIRVGRQYVVVKRVSAKPIDEDEYAVEKELIRDRLLKSARTNYYNSWLAELQADAKIIDNRENMF